MSDSDVEITAYEPPRKRHCATAAQQPSSSTTSTTPSVTWCDEFPNVAGLPSIPLNCPTKPSTSEIPSTSASPDTSGESTSTSYPSSPISISTEPSSPIKTKLAVSGLDAPSGYGPSTLPLRIEMMSLQAVRTSGQITHIS